jgi:hypothetical protein
MSELSDAIHRVANAIEIHKRGIPLGAIRAFISELRKDNKDAVAHWSRVGNDEMLLRCRGVDAAMSRLEDFLREYIHGGGR